MTTIERLRTIVGNICDPELPPLTLADLGILRSVERIGGSVVVTVTPTYSGCPAVEYIEDEIRSALDELGCEQVSIERALSPAWTSDWITAEGRRKLAAAGIAPPRTRPEAEVPVMVGQSSLPPPPCPRCTSADTTRITAFASTACKALYRCNHCSEPFDHFKEI